MINIIQTFASLNETDQEELLDELKLIHKGINDRTINIFARKYPEARFLWYVIGPSRSINSIPLEKFKKYLENWMKYSQKIKSALCEHYDRILYFSSTGEKFLISYDPRSNFINEKDNLDEYTSYIIDNMYLEEIYLDGVSLETLIINT